MEREGEGNGKRGRKSKRARRGRAAPFIVSGILGYCQVTVGQSLDRMLTVEWICFSERHDGDYPVLMAVHCKARAMSTRSRTRFSEGRARASKIWAQTSLRGTLWTQTSLRGMLC